MESTCRICMKISKENISLIEYIDENGIKLSKSGEMFEECCALKVVELLDFENICKSCKMLLKYFHDFKKMALNTYEKLEIFNKENLIKNSDIKWEIKEEYLIEDNSTNESEILSLLSPYNENLISSALIEYDEGQEEDPQILDPDPDPDSNVNPEEILDNPPDNDIKDDDISVMTVEYLDDELENYNKFLQISDISSSDYKEEFEIDYYDTTTSSILLTETIDNDDQILIDSKNHSDFDEIITLEAADKCEYVETLEERIQMDDCTEYVEYNDSDNNDNDENNCEYNTGTKKKYRCNDCNMFFKREYTFKAHMNIHKGLSPYSCQVCKKGFKFKNNYEYHMKNHFNDRDFKCDKCEKSFLVRWDLRIHKRVHENERPYACHICGKQFRVHSHLSDHFETHGEEKKYNCPYCDQKFKTKATLKMHKDSIHERSRRFFCSACGKAFNRNHHLKTHMKCHELKKPT